MVACKPHHLALASEILSREAGADLDTGAVARGIERTFQRLHDGLAGLVGSGGSNAFFERAVHLTQRDHAWLAALVGSSPSFDLTQLTEQVRAVGSEPALRGAGALVATLLALFSAFVGEPLTARALESTWPGITAPGTVLPLAKETT